MSAERMIPEEVEDAFIEWIKMKGIKVALFDLDDTFVDTQKVFSTQIAAFKQFVADVSDNFDEEEYDSLYSYTHAEVVERMGVSPKHWEEIVNVIAEHYGENVKSGISFLNEIYSTLPDLFEGVIETLDIFKKAGVRLGLVTHASEDWTNFKIEGHDIKKYFEVVIPADPEIYKWKTSENWRQGIDSFGVNADEVMVIGDNLRGDMMAAHEAGVKTLVKLPSPWGRYGEGEEIEGMYEIKQFKDLVSSVVTQA